MNGKKAKKLRKLAKIISAKQDDKSVKKVYNRLKTIKP